MEKYNVQELFISVCKSNCPWICQVCCTHFNKRTRQRLVNNTIKGALHGNIYIDFTAPMFTGLLLPLPAIYNCIGRVAYFIVVIYCKKPDVEIGNRRAEHKKRRVFICFTDIIIMCATVSSMFYNK